MATVRARYEKGVLTPLEPLELEEGEEVVVSVEGPLVPEGTSGENLLGTTDSAPVHSKGLLGLVERIEKMRDSYPPDLWDGVPADGAKNFKHYLYGHPKVED